MSLSELALKTKLEADPLGKALIYLRIEGYVNFASGGPYLNSDPLIEITEKGVSAMMGAYFKKDNSKIFWSRFVDFSLVVCNAAIATAAVVALCFRNDDRLKAIESRLSIIEQAANKRQPPLHTPTSTYLGTNDSTTSPIPSIKR